MHAMLSTELKCLLLTTVEDRNSTSTVGLHTVSYFLYLFNHFAFQCKHYNGNRIVSTLLSKFGKEEWIKVLIEEYSLHKTIHHRCNFT